MALTPPKGDRGAFVCTFIAATGLRSESCISVCKSRLGRFIMGEC